MGDERNQPMTKACGHREGGRGGSHKTQGSFKTLADIVAAYIRCGREDLDKDLAYYRASGTWARAVERASKAERHDGTFHPHQWRVGEATMAKVKEPLLALGRRKFDNFGALHEAVREAVCKKGHKIPRIGPLAVYDTALRLAAFRGILPDRVHLHSGTLEGAKNLGLNLREKKSLAMSDLPSEFRKLKAYEVENCLCIYKEHFKPASALQKV